MNRFVGFFTIATLFVVLTACENKQEPAPAASPGESVAAPVIDAASVVNPVETLAFNVATDKFNSQSGELIEGRLVNNGKAGYVLYGPYVSFLAGTYTVAIKGSVEGLPLGAKLNLDTASGNGKSVHGKVVVEKAGELPTFEFTLPEAVGDLEIRVNAPQGAEVSIESYQVSKKS